MLQILFYYNVLSTLFAKSMQFKLTSHSDLGQRAPHGKIYIGGSLLKLYGGGYNNPSLVSSVTKTAWVDEGQDQSSGLGLGLCVRA